MSELLEKASKLKNASKQLGMLSTEDKNAALLTMADHLLTEKEWLIAENAKDIKAGKENGFSESLLD
ncbi:gamma-glutamyl-phosphate reductase, partial [Neobacillus drentensis]